RIDVHLVLVEILDLRHELGLVLRPPDGILRHLAARRIFRIVRFARLDLRRWRTDAVIPHAAQIRVTVSQAWRRGTLPLSDDDRQTHRAGSHWSGCRYPLKSSRDHSDLRCRKRYRGRVCAELLEEWESSLGSGRRTTGVTAGWQRTIRLQ